jgi:undecaprenyl-diphosphatase
MGPFLLVAAAALLTNMIVTAVKLAVGRDRPPAVIVDPEPLMEVPTTSSFPSGHAATSFAGAVVLSRLVGKGVFLLIVLAVLIAFSRVYVGVHYPLDVVAGAALGALVGGAVVALAVRLPRRPSGARPRRAESPPPG